MSRAKVKGRPYPDVPRRRDGRIADLEKQLVAEGVLTFQHYEYTSEIHDGGVMRRLHEPCNRMDEQGWELCRATAVGGNEVSLMWRRPRNRPHASD